MEIRLGYDLKAETIIDFADFVFSKSHCPHDFAALLPKNYGPGRTKPENHVVALDENRALLGMVMFDAFDLSVGAETLKAVCIGTVSVHPRARGMGIMKRLMAKMEEQEAVKNADLLLLGGRRQRYEYYGFTLSGMACRYVVNADNNRHALPKSTLAVQPLEDHHMQAAMEIMHGSDVHVKHAADSFYQAHCSWNARPFVLADGGKVIGLADVNRQEAAVCQLTLASSDYAGAAVKALYDDIGRESVNFEMGADDPLNAFLARIASGMDISWHKNYRIKRFHKVIAAFIALKNKKTPLAKGAFSLAVEGIGLINITVNETGIQVDVSQTNEKGISQMDACRFFFSPMSGYLPVSAPPGWFPLPLFIPNGELC